MSLLDIDPQSVAADPAISAFVTANAGSGKTKTLIDRVARLLLSGALPETILCVTYTKAAAAEMQRRLFDLLGGWSVRDGETLKQDLARLEGRDPSHYDEAFLSKARALFARALETPGGLKIQTIHAFCEKLLRRFPADRAVRTHVIIVSTPSLSFSPRLVEAEEPVRVQAPRPELAVEGLDEGIVGRLPRAAEVEHDALLVGP